MIEIVKSSAINSVRTSDFDFVGNEFHPWKMRMTCNLCRSLNLYSEELCLVVGQNLLFYINTRNLYIKYWFLFFYVEVKWVNFLFKHISMKPHLHKIFPYNNFLSTLDWKECRKKILSLNASCQPKTNIWRYVFNRFPNCCDKKLLI